MNEHLYDKKLNCPICSNESTTKAVKINSPRRVSQDSDFFIRYNVINPYLYDVWICNKCGYSSMKCDFTKIKSFQKELILKSITPKWASRNYPDELTPKHAIERYKLALINSNALERPASSSAMICLKIAWMCRLINDISQENLFLNRALESFSTAYFYEDFPMYGLNRDALTYLIGELNRRLGNFTEATVWYSKTLTTPGFSSKIKELARDGRNLINEAKSSITN
ncbi:MAG: DUF2225 domain-containing protein [Clostridium sp.]